VLLRTLSIEEKEPKLLESLKTALGLPSSGQSSNTGQGQGHGSRPNPRSRKKKDDSDVDDLKKNVKKSVKTKDDSVEKMKKGKKG